MNEVMCHDAGGPYGYFTVVTTNTVTTTGVNCLLHPPNQAQSQSLKCLRQWPLPT